MTNRREEGLCWGVRNADISALSVKSAFAHGRRNRRFPQRRCKAREDPGGHFWRRVITPSIAQGRFTSQPRAYDAMHAGHAGTESGTGRTFDRCMYSVLSLSRIVSGLTTRGSVLSENRRGPTDATVTHVPLKFSPLKRTQLLSHRAEGRHQVGRRALEIRPPP